MERTMTPQDLAERIEGQVVGQWLLDNVADAPDGVALQWRTADGEFDQLTWAQVLDQARGIAGRLTAWGIGAGDSVALFLRNRPEFHVADLGALLCRAMSNSIYNSSAPEQIQYLLAHMEAKVVICDDLEFLERVLEVRDELPDLEHVVVIDDPDGRAPDDVARFEELLAGEPVDAEAAVAASQPGDIVTLIYTSGTTGTPKGVALDHANIAASAASVFSLVGEDGGQLREISYLPMAHIAERMVSHYGWLAQRHEVTTCPEPTELITYLGPVRPQALFGPPRVFEKLRSGILAAVAGQGEEKAAQFEQALEVGTRVANLRAMGEDVPEDLATMHAGIDAQAFAPLRAMVGLDEIEYAFAGAAPLPTHVFDFMRGIGVPFSEVYGMSENTGGMTWDPYRVKQGTVGRPVPGTEVRLADDSEVLCRGPIVTRGYHKDPERTAEAFDDEGWLHTGDIGRFDDEGYLSIIDRKKELIITASGKNVSPANIEAQLKSLPLVAQACVIGDDRPYLTALLVLDVDVAPGWAADQGIEDTSLAALSQHPEVHAAIDAGVEDALAGFNNVERIKKWTILDVDWEADSPQMTATMKLKRRGVHATHEDEIESMYA